jgi:hypothetical protein
MLIRWVPDAQISEFRRWPELVPLIHSPPARRKVLRLSSGPQSKTSVTVASSPLRRGARSVKPPMWPSGRSPGAPRLRRRVLRRSSNNPGRAWRQVQARSRVSRDPKCRTSYRRGTSGRSAKWCHRRRSWLIDGSIGRRVRQCQRLCIPTRRNCAGTDVARFRGCWDR